MPFQVKDLGSIRDLGRAWHWSSRQLKTEISVRCDTLAEREIGPGSTVAITHAGSAAFFADLLSVWCRGAAAACLDPSNTDIELANIISHLEPDLILLGEEARTIPQGFASAQLAGGGKASASDLISLPAGAEPCLILFTSGTTGRPKGVVHSFDSIAARIGHNIDEIGANVLRHTLVTLPTHFGHGLIGNALTSLFAGGEIVLPHGNRPLARDLDDIIKRYDITFLSSTPALWRLAMRLCEPLGECKLARVHIGSAPLSVDLWREIADWTGAEVVNCYGMTETANWISGASSKSGELSIGLVGKMWGGEAVVLAASGEISATGEGEILIKSPSIMLGYRHDKPTTEATFLGHWFRTGDSGTITPDGAIRLTGRLKDQINRAGFKIQPAEVDALLLTHPDVDNVCTFAVPDTAAGEIVGTAVILKEGCANDASGLKAWALARARRELVPERWFFVDALKLSARGKINRAGVADMCLNKKL